MRRLLTLITIGLLATTLTAAQAGTPKSAAKHETTTQDASRPANMPTEATVDSFLQQTFGYQSDVTWKISSIKPGPVQGLVELDVILANSQGQQLSKLYITPDGQHALVGDIIPFGARPYDPAEKALQKGMNGPAKGPKDAPVTIVEFGDLQCPACKAAQPQIEKLVASEPNARFVFQSFPLEMHNWAAKGAAYADCVGRDSNDAFWKFISKTYDTQPEITAENADEKLTAIANDVGLNGAQIAACSAKPDTKAHVDASIELGKEVDVTGTPTLFINGRKIGNVSQLPPEMLKNLVDFAAKDQK